MKLVITDTNGEQLTIATSGDKDGRQTNNSIQDADDSKQTAQKPQEPAPAANGDKEKRATAPAIDAG